MRAEEERSFREFARSRAVVLRRSAYLLCGDWHLAEDLVQNTLLKLYRAWRRVDGDAADAYARKVLMRVWLDERRKPWRRSENRDGVVPDPGDPLADPAVAGQRAQARDLVLSALAEVPPRQRAVLVLRYWEDLPTAEVAAALRCSEGTVKSQASRGLRNLRAAIARTAPDLAGAGARRSA
ncbi:RNA polymerase sigma-70 factor (sigma-E family) [Saccharopolyspora erythraea NRRL 2338]|uniref:RNA polymerase ECF sigma factor n=2 Tax=Saccharopolyspora erythraea TaxID=1836 RepID=A4FQI7_SACEN|nr:SigE family RNA polymerase sigma factor [Saccharopolyspora erythraea]EQD86601.1 RNA polymerase sigma24 factor [Saccharopolyspora erythraea D]PFG92915.1 RNA polymerase sigma-70 factor (sigma-E family) [Saccharopolyspora erythraea NRRL 2338]QRK89815.1 SigE family RNA polymerase sigma factor [Saccharopolyspora erythraea]CAM06312.1 RNA polymerase ECF sigma factor [Saccharopolyspora erythraea NRRL 2338]